MQKGEVALICKMSAEAYFTCSCSHAPKHRDTHASDFCPGRMRGSSSHVLPMSPGCLLACSDKLIFDQSFHACTSCCCYLSSAATTKKDQQVPCVVLAITLLPLRWGEGEHRYKTSWGNLCNMIAMVEGGELIYVYAYLFSAASLNVH